MLIKFSLLTFSFFLALSVLGQYTYPPYRQYTLRDGLSQMQAMKIIQDSRGYIWVGTKEGLNCFNGSKITSFSEKDGLVSDYIQDVAEDNTGKIWASTKMGLSTFDGSKIISFPHKDQLSVEIIPTPDGKIWYAGMDHTRKTIIGYFENGIYTDKTYVLPNKEGGFLFEYSRKENSFVISNVKDLFEFKENRIRQLLSVKNEFGLVGNDSAILVYEHNNKNILHFWEYRDRQLIDIGGYDSSDSLFLDRIKGDYTFHDPFQNTVIHLNQKGIEVNKITDIDIAHCLVDRDKHLWLATEEGVLQVFSGGFETYKREFLPVIWSVVEDHSHNLWFASYNYGIKKFDGRTFTHYTEEMLKKYALNFYFQPQVDQRGMLYFPNNYGIFYTDGKSFGAIRQEPCLATFYDKERDLLFGGYRIFVEVYDKNHQLVRKITESDGLEFKGYISSFGKDPSGDLWMGGFSGLCRYNWETGKVINYNQNNKKLPSEGVLSIFTSPDGRTWFGGTHGLLWYDSHADSIRKIEQEDISGNVSFVTAIDSTWLVFSQSTGVYLMDLKKFNRSGAVELYFFNENNGFLGIDPGQNGAMVDSKGNIWMTSSTEVVKLDPKKLDLKNYSVNVRLSHFNGQRLPFDQKEISLPKNDRTAIVQFEAICFNRPKSAQYSWKIERHKHDWSPWQEEDYAVLTDLHDGESQIQVRVRIPGLPKAEAMTAMPLVVNLAIWKQDWFFPTLLGIVSLLVLLSISMLYKTRMRMIQVNKQAKMFQLQAILSQLNPHFIFNVMASLQSMILSANIEKANDYLVKMSGLIRGFLDASASSGFSKSKDITATELPLKKELEILDHFIQFQQLIYPDKFDYELSLGPDIQPEKLTVPPMLIQPFVENSIKHGLLQKSGRGKLKISIQFSEKQTLMIEIEDDGIGIKKAEAIMSKSPLLYTSRGKELTLKRIKLLNDMGYFIQFRTDSTELGTKVTLKVQRNAE